MKLSRELWLQVEPLLTTALDMDVAARAAWLAGIDATHPEAAPVLRRMLETHDRAERSNELETVPRLAPAPGWSSVHASGARIGPFELISPLGHGGMGEVWLARQADERVERNVALKLPAVNQASEVWRERFQRERDILAKLEHPHIARLYDAGVTGSGQPWLAMEFVEGQSLSEHVAARSPSIPGRLALFRQVLAAVAHAHRHLVVHRDLKPANILIDASGQARLLDFGIAKLVDEDEPATELTRLGGRVMTLRYAAPEQVASGVITTATDIYSLGVILHEMLTGLSPYRAVRDGKPLTDVMLLQEEIAVPRISGDLDAIVLKALRRDPAARYASVEQFDDDILAHLEARPVKARAGTWRYLAGRFAIRHKLPLATVAAVLVTLIAGLVMADRERRVAVAEKARAERHFASVRKLANAFVFDVHGEIENLAGSLKARRLLVSTSLEYLDSLAKESSDDPELGLEVATTYRKIAAILGGPQNSNLGEPAAARRHAEKARALLAALEARSPQDLRVLRERRATEQLLARILTEAADPSVMAASEEAVRVAERIVALPGATAEDRRNLALVLTDYAFNLAVIRSDFVAAVAPITRATEYLEALNRANPADLVARANLAGAYERASIITELSRGDQYLPRAIALLQQSIAATEALARDEPLNQAHEQALIKRYANIAESQRDNGELPAASASIGRALDLGARVVAREPGNKENVASQLRALAVASGVEHARASYDRAIARGREAFALYSTLPDDVRKGLRVRAHVSTAKSYIGASQLAQAAEPSLPPSQRLSLARDARVQLVESRAFRQELIDRNIDVASSVGSVGELSAEITKCDALIARLERG